MIKYAIACLTWVLATKSLAATCSQQRNSNDDPSGQTVASALFYGIQNVCNNGNPQFPPDSSTISTWNTGSIVWNISRSDNSTSVSDCNAGFTNIINQCITSGDFWGGTWSLNEATFTITNPDSSTNPLLGAATPSLTDLINLANSSITSFSSNLTDTDSAQAAETLLKTALAGKYCPYIGTLIKRS